MPRKHRPIFGSVCITVALLCGTTSAHAVGHRIDVQIVDRDTGEMLTPILHDGAWWVAGRPGARYGVLLNNTGTVRRLGVVAVDGINAITGDVADWKQTGYVLDHHDSTEIDGWRKNADEVAAFTFTALPDSYAAQAGRPADVGVIGVAVFDERSSVRPVMRRTPRADQRGATDETPARASSLIDSTTDRSAVPAPAPTASSSPPPTIVESESRRDAAMDTKRLGTGHGPVETSAIRFVDFERARTRPDEIVTIHYDRRERLIAMGILPSPSAIAARPFPGDDPHMPRFVPDPPRR